MNIKVGDYVLRSDTYQMWIERQVPNGKGGLTITKVAGYSPDFKTLCKSFLQHNYRSSGAEDMRQLLKDMEKAEKETVAIIEEYFKVEAEEEPEEDLFDEDL